ncbi:hypothetical protein [Arenimonas oryziterrae]
MARLTDAVLALSLTLMLAGCPAPENPPPTTSATTPPTAQADAPPPLDIAAAITSPEKVSAEPGQVDTTCKTDADCAIKDVGNCCGAYPACVNKDSPTFPAQVKAQCQKEGTMAVCGFPSINGCQCVQGKCAPQNGAATSSDSLK